MLTLNDGRAELWQWDTGRTLAVDADCSQVHFSNKVFGRSIDVDVVDGAAIIPDILLQSDNDLNVWAFSGTAENGYTKISKTFKVNRRNKPADYVFTPTEQTTLAELVELITAAAEHPPVPGENGCWMIWDVSAGAYRQSDVPVTVAPVDRTADMTQPVGRDQDGRLWTAPGGGGGGDENAVRYTAQKLNDAQKEQARKNIGAGTSSFSGSYDDLTGKPTIPDGNLGITGASVGQIAKITAVDDDGKPTVWEPVDMPSGGGGSFEMVYSWTADGTVISNLDSFKVESGKVYYCELIVPYGEVLSAPIVYVRIGSAGNSYTGGIIGNVSGRNRYLDLMSKYLFFTESNKIHVILDRVQNSQNVPSIANYAEDNVYIYSGTADVAILDGTTVNIYKLG